jgi:hypothetical protein
MDHAGSCGSCRRDSAVGADRERDCTDHASAILQAGKGQAEDFGAGLAAASQSLSTTRRRFGRPSKWSAGWWYGRGSLSALASASQRRSYGICISKH